MNNFEREFNWDDEINQDSEFVLLPEGEYIFTVEKVERGRHNPSGNGKLPACNKAIVSVKIVGEQGETTLKHNLFLHSSTEGMLSAFFGALGLKKKGEPLKMNWNIAGMTGVCMVGTRTYNDNKYNEVKRMIYKEDVDFSKVLNQNVQPSIVQPQQPAFNFGAQQPMQGFTPATNTPFS